LQWNGPWDEYILKRFPNQPVKQKIASELAKFGQHKEFIAREVASLLGKILLKTTI